MEIEVLGFSVEQCRFLAEGGWRFGGVAPDGQLWRLSPETFAKVQDRLKHLEGWQFFVAAPSSHVVIDWGSAKSW